MDTKGDVRDAGGQELMPAMGPAGFNALRPPTQKKSGPVNKPAVPYGCCGARVASQHGPILHSKI
jgi:hypothetical protein